MKTEDYLTLPDFIENIVPVVLDPAASKAYTKLEREMLLQVDTETITGWYRGRPEWKAAAALRRRRVQQRRRGCSGT